MAVRIQFRRGTAAEWASANPTLAAGELGYETDTAQIKIGNGTSDWDNLAYAAVSASYIDDAIANVVGLSPEDLDTLQELAAAIGDDADFVNTISSSIDSHTDATTDVHGIADTSLLETTSGAQTKANNAQANAAAYTDNAIANLIDSSPSTLDTLNELAAALGDDPNFATTVTTSLGSKLQFVSDTGANLVAANATTTANTIYIESDAPEYIKLGDGVTAYNDLGYVGQTYANLTVSEHANETTDVHGIEDTANLAYVSDITAHSSITTNVHGISNTANLAYQSDVALVAADLETHEESTTNVHGISNTANLAYQSDVALVAADLETHEESTTNVHGITNTADLAYLTDVNAVTSNLTSHTELTLDVHGISNTANLAYQSDVALAVTEIETSINAVTASLDVHVESTLNVHGIANTAELVTTSDLGGASSTEIGYLIGVTSGVQDQIATKAPVYSPTFSGTVSLPTDTSIGNVSSTALSYLENVTGDVQTQLTQKLGQTWAETYYARLGEPATFTSNVVIDAVSTGSFQINTASASVTHENLIHLKDITFDLAQALNNKANSSSLLSYAPISNATFDSMGYVVLPADTTIGNVSSTVIGYLEGLTSSVQGQIDNTLPLSGGTLTGQLILHADPTEALHASTKQYVDNVASGILAKPAVYAATTANLDATYSNGTDGVGATLTATSNGAFPVVDGVQLTTDNGTRGILVKNQSNSYENGRYNLTTLGDASNPWVLTRCGLCDEADEIPGMYVFVTDGTTNEGTAWVGYVSDPATYVVGTDALSFFQFAGAGVVTAGNNISVSGNQVSTTADPTFNNVVANTITSTGLVVQYNGLMFSDNTVQYSAGVPSLSSFTEETASYELDDLSLRDSVVEMNSSSALTFTIPDDNTLAWPVGGSMDIIQTGTGQVTIANAVGVTLNYTPGNKLRTQWSSCTIMKRSANTWILYGDLTA